MNELEIKSLLLISIQRALLGMIDSSVRAIAVGNKGVEKLKIIYYLDREPLDDDYDNLSEVTGEVCADIPFTNVEEMCIYSKEPFSKLDHLVSWVYMRKEG